MTVPAFCHALATRALPLPAVRARLAEAGIAPPGAVADLAAEALATGLVVMRPDDALALTLAGVEAARAWTPPRTRTDAPAPVKAGGRPGGGPSRLMVTPDILALLDLMRDAWRERADLLASTGWTELRLNRGMKRCLERRYLDHQAFYRGPSRFLRYRARPDAPRALSVAPVTAAERILALLSVRGPMTEAEVIAALRGRASAGAIETALRNLRRRGRVQVLGRRAVGKGPAAFVYALSAGAGNGPVGAAEGARRRPDEKADPCKGSGSKTAPTGVSESAR